MALLQKGQLRAFTADKRACTRVATPSRACTRVVAQRSSRASTVTCQAKLVHHAGVANIAITSAMRTGAAAATLESTKKDVLNRSYYPTGADSANSTKQWYVIDAEGQTLGRLACLAATYIRGKHLPTYSPSMDMGAFVVVVNAEKVQVSGNKFFDKTYFNQGVNGRPGSHRLEKFRDLQARIPERIIERAVRGMLPKGAMGRNIKLHLKVFKGAAHTHEAQQPINITSEISVRPSKSAGAKLLEEVKAKA